MSDMEEEVHCSRNRGIVGTNCKARIIVRDRVLKGSWCIKEVELEHNHELQPDSVRLMRCHRELSLFVKKQLKINKCVGLAQNKSICTTFIQAEKAHGWKRSKSGSDKSHGCHSDNLNINLIQVSILL